MNRFFLFILIKSNTDDEIGQKTLIYSQFYLESKAFTIRNILDHFKLAGFLLKSFYNFIYPI